MRKILLLVLLLLQSCSEQTTAPAPDAIVAPQSETQRLNIWLDAEFEKDLDFSPQWRTQLGDKKDYDKLDDVSEAADDARLAWRRQSIAAMHADFSYSALTDEGKDSFDLWVFLLDSSERDHAFRRHQYLIGRGGPQTELPSFLINYHSVENVADMHAYVARLQQLGPVMQQYLQRVQLARTDGIVQPKFNYLAAVAEIDNVLAGAPFNSAGSSALWDDANNKLNALLTAGSINAVEKEQLLSAVRLAAVNSMQPAYLQVRSWLQQQADLVPDAANGVWALPDGEAYYRARLIDMTTLQLTADEIHNTGLAEVARLRDAMETIRQQVGFTGDLQAFFTHLRDSPQFYVQNTDEGRKAYLDLATRYLDEMAVALPDYFGILPKAPLLVKRVEAFREVPGAAQFYESGSPDGTRPGVFYVHMSDMNAMQVPQLESIAFHEGSPGHHMQQSIAQELTDIPRFRTQYWFTAHVEGWALYSETLAKEMGFYTDPYSDFGRLSGEMWRAIRLVVDTGLHSKQWTQQQAMLYALSNSPEPAGSVRAEIERYLIWPGQATAYKIGMLKIQELRERARTQLGDRFDIREFHDTVLGGGSLPLPLLEARVARWIQGKLQ